MLCASRGGFVGLSVVMLVVALRSSHRVRDLSILGALVAGFTLFSPVSPLQRILRPGYGDNLAKDSRLVVWKAGIKMVKENPLTGVGLGNFRAVVLDYEEPGENIRLMAHNTYIELAAEMGIPVLLLFITMLLAGCRSLENVRQRARQSGQNGLRLCAQGMQAGLLGYAVAAAFLPGEYQKLLWLMIFLTMRMPGLVRRRGPRRVHPTARPVHLARVEA
jgi:O-antigen ligase